MLGVVLWSDTDDNKAVIWCEDHGNLAYFSGGNHPSIDIFEFDTGDLIQFELSEDQHMRFAHNPKRVSQNQYPGLVEDLQCMTLDQDDTVCDQSDLISTSPQATGGEVLPFSR